MRDKRKFTDSARRGGGVRAEYPNIANKLLARRLRAAHDDAPPQQLLQLTFGLARFLTVRGVITRSHTLIEHTQASVRRIMAAAAELPGLEELEELVTDALPQSASSSAFALPFVVTSTGANTDDGGPLAAAAAAVVAAEAGGSGSKVSASPAPMSSPASSGERAEPLLSVWSSYWFMTARPVRLDAGENEGEGTVHERMVSGWDTDIGNEWAEPPRFKPRRFITEWVMNALQPVPNFVLALYWTVTGSGRPWRSLDGFAATQEDQADRGVIERGHASGKFYLKVAVGLFFLRFFPTVLGCLYYEELRDGKLLPMGLAYAVLQTLTLNQPAAKVAFQLVSANRRLQSAFERRKNEFLTGWLIAALDVAIFEIRLAAARTCLDLEDRMTFECSVAEMRHFLAPVLHAVDQPDERGRRPKEELVQQLLGGHPEGLPAAHWRHQDSELLAALDSGNVVLPAFVSEAHGHAEQQRCTVPVKLVMLRVLWYAVQRDGSYRNQGGNGVRSNVIGGPAGACAQLSMLLTIVAAPHIVRVWEGAEAMTTAQLAFCIVTGCGFIAGTPIVAQFCTAPVFDLARRRHCLVACRTLISGRGIRPLPPLARTAAATTTQHQTQHAAVPAPMQYARSLAIDGIDLNASGASSMLPAEHRCFLSRTFRGVLFFF